MDQTDAFLIHLCSNLLNMSVWNRNWSSRSFSTLLVWKKNKSVSKTFKSVVPTCLGAFSTKLKSVFIFWWYVETNICSSSWKFLTLLHIRFYFLLLVTEWMMDPPPMGTTAEVFEPRLLKPGCTKCVFLMC